MKTVLAFTENYARGGGNRYMIDSLNGLPDRVGNLLLACNPGGVDAWDTARLRRNFKNCEWPIWTPTRLGHRIKADSSFDKFLRVPVKILGLLLTPFFHLYNFSIFLKKLIRIKPHLVLAFNGGYPGGSSLVALCCASHLLKIPVVMSVVSQPIPKRGKEKFLGEIRDRLIGRVTSGIQVNAKTISERLFFERGISAEKLFLIPNGVPALEQPVTRNYKKAATSLIVGFVGRIEKQKGIWTLLAAIKALHKDYPGLQFELAGDGAELQIAKSWCEKNALRSSVHFLGFQEGSIEKKMENWDIFVFPSLYEGLPYAILEAMRSAMPIIASNVGGIPEAVRNGQEALLVQPGSASELEQSLRRLLNDKTLRQELGTSAQFRYEERYTLDAMAKSLETLFSHWI